MTGLNKIVYLTKAKVFRKVEFRQAVFQKHIGGWLTSAKEGCD